MSEHQEMALVLAFLFVFLLGVFTGCLAEATSCSSAIREAKEKFDKENGK